MGVAEKGTLSAVVLSVVMLISGTLISATPLAHAILAPHDLYFLSLSGFIPDLSDRAIPENETAFMVTWAKARQLPEMAELGSHGPYSVLIWPYIKRYEQWDEGTWTTVEYEMIVVASTLQPDSEGLIHQLVIRFAGSAWYDCGCSLRALNLYSLDQLTLVKCYADEYTLNPTLFEDGKKTIEKLLTQEVIDPKRYSDENYRVDYPFLTLFYGPIAFPYDPSDPSYLGVTVILNLKTGRIMIAVLADLQMNPTGDFSIGWRYTCESRLLYPDRMPAPGIGIGSISGAEAVCQGGDAAKGSIHLELYREFVSPYPWNDLTFVEVWINNTRQDNRIPPLPAIPLVSWVRKWGGDLNDWWHLNPPSWYYAINITTGATLASNYQIRLVFSAGPEFVYSLTIPMPDLRTRDRFSSAFGLKPKMIDLVHGPMISADMNNDGSVDIFDAVILAGCNGQHA